MCLSSLCKRWPKVYRGPLTGEQYQSSLLYHAGKSSCTLATVGPWRGSLESCSVFGHLFAFGFPYWVGERGLLWLATHKADCKISTMQSRSAPCLIIVVLIMSDFFRVLFVGSHSHSWNSMLHCCVHWEIYSNVEEINRAVLKVSVLNYWPWQRKYWISPVLLTQHTALTFCLPRGTGHHYQPAVSVCEMIREFVRWVMEKSPLFNPWEHLFSIQSTGRHYSSFTQQVFHRVIPLSTHSWSLN